MLRNIGSNWFLMAVTGLATFFLMPFNLAHLGNTQYGIWLVISALTAYLSLLLTDGERVLGVEAHLDGQDCGPLYPAGADDLSFVVLAGRFHGIEPDLDPVAADALALDAQLGRDEAPKGIADFLEEQ